jgi:hypothetical protein
VSARRAYDKDGKPVWVQMDDGAVGRTTHTRGAITGGQIIEPLPNPTRKPRDHALEHARRKA